MITLVKFIRNKLETAPPNNRVITKTLGKTGVLSWEHIENQEQIPKPDEFWYVRIVKEVGANTPKGVFLLAPIEKVKDPDRTDGDSGIIHMIPGTYVEKKNGNTILLYPKILYYPEKLAPHWICSLQMKRRLMEKSRDGDTFAVNSVVVVFDSAEEWVKEDLVKKDTGPKLSEIKEESST